MTRPREIKSKILCHQDQSKIARMLSVVKKHSSRKDNRVTRLAGRPAKLPDLDQLMIKVLTEEQNDVTAMEAILKKMVVEAIVKGNIQATQVVLDRAYGKSKQPIQLFNPKGEPVNPDKSMIIKKWGVFSVPYKILIDKNGVIVDKDMPIDRLDEKLVKLL